MIRKILVLALCPLVLAACSRPMGGHYSLAMESRALMKPGDNEDFSYDHNLSLAMARRNIKPRFERAQDRCLHDGALNCKLISASIDLSNETQSSNAELIVALPHDKIAAFEKGLLAPLAGESAGDARVRSRSMSAENVSAEAGNVSSKLAQLTDYRDRLAALAKRPDLSVDDLIRIESELSKAQSDLDDMAARKADVGDRVSRERMTISLEERPSAGDAFRPIGQVWQSAITLLGESAANALQFLIQVIPWLPLIVGAFYLLPWMWRLARRRSAVAKSAKPSGD
jgi:hypothetical protein